MRQWLLNNNGNFRILLTLTNCQSGKQGAISLSFQQVLRRLVVHRPPGGDHSAVRSANSSGNSTTSSIFFR